MAKLLANENIPAAAIEAARLAGHDVAWVAESTPGADDAAVLSESLRDGRVLITFDKDFGKLAFRMGLQASCGIILLRPTLRSPDHVSRFLLNVLAQPINWEGHFAVASEGRVRVVPLPA